MNIYIWCVYIGAICGVISGYINWIKWLENRISPKITIDLPNITVKIMEPIIGIIWDILVLFLNIIATCIVYSIIVALFPILIVILIIN